MKLKTPLLLSPLLLLFMKKKKTKTVETPETTEFKADLSETPKDIFFKDKNDFIKKMLPIAREVERLYKIPYLFLLAQTALETSWGQSDLVKLGANFAGIKQFDKTKPQIMAWTREDVLNPESYPSRDKNKDKKKGIYTSIYLKQPFAKFNTLNEGLSGYLKVLKLPRYAKAYRYNDVKNFAQEIKNGGYATGVNYVATIVDIANDIEEYIKKNNL